MFACSSINKYKAFEYLFLVASEDEETQKKGVVGIHWIKGENVPLPDKREPTSKQIYACTFALVLLDNSQCNNASSRLQDQVDFFKPFR